MDLDRLIGDIYDCAANPELWPETLGRVRDVGDFAYVMVGYMDGSLPAEGINNVKHSEWDAGWVQRLREHVPTIPHLQRLFEQGIDVPWLQMDHLAEAEFQQSDFYRNWVKPQKLRDGMNTLFINRRRTQGVMVMTRYEGKPLFGERERQIANALSPHVRRAIAINDMVDKANLALTLYRQVLDALSVAVFIVGTGGKPTFANAKAEGILSEGDLLRLSGGKLVATRTDLAGAKLEDAVARAGKGDRALGISGIGVPLVGKSGERAAAYVLPISGGDLRGQLGRGYAAVFLARRGEQQPMAIEILRTVFDLTPMEAKIAYAASLGDSTETIAAVFGISVETVRSHLKHVYVKADVGDKTALAVRVNELIPPIDTATE